MQVRGQETLAQRGRAGAGSGDVSSGGLGEVLPKSFERATIMQVIINSDNQVDLDEDFIQHWQSEISSSLQKRFSDWITRVEVHLTDENSKSKAGIDDIRCLIEARPADRQPVSIEVRGASAEHALSDGIQTLSRRLGTLVDKTRTQQRKPN